jgi:hypothetical protein
MKGTNVSHLFVAPTMANQPADLAAYLRRLAHSIEQGQLEAHTVIVLPVSDKQAHQPRIYGRGMNRAEACGWLTSAAQDVLHDPPE